MPKKLVSIPDHVLNEYIFDLLWNITTEERRHLNRRQLNALVSAGAAKRYVTSTGLEDKLVLLAKMGVEFGLYFGNIDGKRISRLQETHKKKGGDAVIKEMQEERIFILSSREVCQFMNLLSSYAHSENYMLNRQFLKVAHRLNKWKEWKSELNDEYAESVEASKEIARFSYQLLNMTKYMDGLTGVSTDSLMILLYLFRFKSNFVEDGELMMRIVPSITKNKYTYAIKKMEKEFFIERKAATKNKQWQITAKGVDTVMKFQKTLLNYINNF